MAEGPAPIPVKKDAASLRRSGGRKLVFVGANPQFVSVDAIFDLSRICFRCIKWENL